MASDERTLEIIDAYADRFRDLALEMAGDLRDAGAIRIHRDWSAAQELRAIASKSADAAVREVVGCDWNMCSAEVLFLHGPKIEAEKVAAE